MRPFPHPRSGLLLAAVLALPGIARSQAQLGNFRLEAPAVVVMHGGVPHLFVVVFGLPHSQPLVWGTLFPSGFFSPRIELRFKEVYFLDQRPCAIGSKAYVNVFDYALPPTETIMRYPLSWRRGIDVWQRNDDPNQPWPLSFSYCDLAFCYSNCRNDNRHDRPEAMAALIEMRTY